MKTYIKKALLLLAISLFFASCQDEVVQIGEPDNLEVINPGSALSNLMQQASANRTGDDDFLDNTSCFSVELPVTVVVGNITIVIENEDGLDELQDLLEELDGEIPEFVFPITIISGDYVETVIENQEQLEAIIEGCTNSDVIECIDFVYPISFSVLNAEFVIVDTVTIADNEALYEFLESLEDNDEIDIVSLNFPVDLVYAHGDTITVNSNEELSDAINAAEDDCDDDEEECDVDNIRNNLKECLWEIEIYSSFQEFEGFELQFNEDFTLEIIVDGQSVSTDSTWEINETDNGIILTLNTDFEDLGGDWLVLECDDDEYKFTKDGEILEIDRDCEDDLDCSAEDLAEDLVECYWFAGTTFLNNADNQFVFTEDGNVKVVIDNEFVHIGSWNIGVEGDALTLVLTLDDNYEPLSGEWEVIECHEGFYSLMLNDEILHLEQECFDDENPFECYPANGTELAECGINGDDVAVFNIYEAIPDCDSNVPVQISFHTTFEGAQNGTDILENATAYESNTQTIYIKVKLVNNPDEYIIYPVELIVEDCTTNPFECFTSFDAVLELCDEGNDGFEVFDLTIAYANCTPTVDNVSYHLSIADANAGTNVIANPQSFTNTSSPQTIYVRVEVDGIYEVFEILIKVEDCSTSDCTEGDVDNILMECPWKITSYNGDDNLINYTLDFVSLENVVITNSDNNETITSFWSTSTSNDGEVEITFDNVAAPEIQAITGTWIVVECTSEQLVLHDTNNDNVEIVMDRICD